MTMQKRKEKMKQEENNDKFTSASWHKKLKMCILI